MGQWVVLYNQHNHITLVHVALCSPSTPLPSLGCMAGARVPDIPIPSRIKREIVRVLAVQGEEMHRSEGQHRSAGEYRESVDVAVVCGRAISQPPVCASALAVRFGVLAE